MNTTTGCSLSLTALIIIVIATSAAAVLSPDTCDQNVDIPHLSFLGSSLNCQVVWSTYNFILRHNYDKSSQILSILLSANTLENWFAIGFSPSGGMVNSSAMVAYWAITGVGVIKQYYLAGKTSSQVLPGEGNLTVIKNSAMVVVQNRTIYMAFQLYIDAPSAASSQVIYAYAYQNQLPDFQTGYISEPHRSTFSQSFDFTTGAARAVSSPIDMLRRSHGIVNIVGWAVLAPVGAFIARYARRWDPMWLYIHVGFQTSAFLLAITGVTLGIKLTRDITTVNWHGHKVLGISILVLGALQVVALCARPQKDSKMRTFWKWCHHIVGRVVLFLAAINILIGLKLAGASLSWKAGYAVILMLTLVCFAILESVYWYKKHKTHRDPIPATFSTYEMM